MLIGLSAFAGLAFMIILIPINTIAANKVKQLQSLQMKLKDERVKVTTEVLSGIKVGTDNTLAIKIIYYVLYSLILSTYSDPN